MQNQRVATGSPTKSGAADDLLAVQIEAAAIWLADNWHVAPQPITRSLREMLGLAFDDAVKALVEAERLADFARERQ